MAEKIDIEKLRAANLAAMEAANAEALAKALTDEMRTMVGVQHRLAAPALECVYAVLEEYNADTDAKITAFAAGIQFATMLQNVESNFEGASHRAFLRGFQKIMNYDFSGRTACRSVPMPMVEEPDD